MLVLVLVLLLLLLVFCLCVQAAAPSKEKNDVDAIAATAQGYYDSDNAFNFYRQARRKKNTHTYTSDCMCVVSRAKQQHAPLRRIPKLTFVFSATGTKCKNPERRTSVLRQTHICLAGFQSDFVSNLGGCISPSNARSSLWRTFDCK